MTNILHVANGHSTTQTLEAAGLPGRTSIWADPLYEGAVPAGLDDEGLLQVRATFIAGGAHPVEEVAGDLRAWRRAIDETARYDELVLWFEHDLFDQLNLIQILSRLSIDWPKTVTLICIGSYPWAAALHGTRGADDRRAGAVVRESPGRHRSAADAGARRVGRVPLARSRRDRAGARDRYLGLAISGRRTGALPRGVPLDPGRPVAQRAARARGRPGRADSRLPRRFRACTRTRPRSTSPTRR